MSVEALNKSRPAGYIIWLLIFIGHIASIGLFTRGFLLTRQVLPDIAQYATNQEFKRAVILVVDALRHDFIIPAEQYNGEYYLNKMPLLDIGGSVFEFTADPPTTTLQRLKGLTTGSLPTFIDAGSNFAGTEILEDNWLLQATLANKSIALVGDDTWDALYGPLFTIKHPFESLNVRDLDTVDNGVKSFMPSLIANTSNEIVIGHMLGVDHVGHRHGPDHPAMADKMTETFEFIEKLAASIDKDTVLFVMGDHGMDQTGNHGGDSELELRAGLWVYAKGRQFGSGFKVHQIDFVPTIAGLLGLPVPFNSLGYPITSLFKDPASIVAATAEQISAYAQKFGYSPIEAGADALTYQRQTLDIFRDSWATFHMIRIYKGIGLLVLSVWCIVSLYQTLTPANLVLKARRMSYGAGVGLVCAATVVYFSRDSNAINAGLDVLGGLAAGAYITSLALPQLSLPTWRTSLAIVVLVLHCASLFSNSFTVWESRITLYLAITCILFLLFRCIGMGAVEQYIGAPCALTVISALRGSSLLYVCREEYGPDCASTFYEREGTSMTGYWAIVAMSVLIIGFPLLLRLSYTIGQNMTGIASICLQAGVPVAMMLVTTFWSIDAAEVRGYLPTMPVLNTIKTVLSRIVLGISFFASPYIWYKSTPCVSIDITSGSKPKILGFQNIFGAYAYLPLIFLSWAILISSKPPAILCICALVLAIYNASDLFDLTNSKQSILAQVCLILFGFMVFFSTGHQMTLVSIQWDSAFIASHTLSYPISAITVYLNTLGPFLLVGIAAVLISVWRRAQHTDSRMIYSLVIRAMLGTAGVAATQAICSMVAATILRRHLMTWKIFAPRYIYGALILLTIDVGAFLGLAVSDHAIKTVTTLFGG